MSGKALLSIDIGAKNIHIIEGAVKNGAIEITKAVLVNTPLGAFSDGKIEEISLITEAIKSALLNNKIKTNRVVFNTQSSAVIIRDIVLPFMKNEEIQNAVKFEMEQYFPSNQESYNIEFKISNTFFEEEQKKYKIRAAAMPISISENYYKLASDLKLEPVALDIHSNSISKLFENNFSINSSDFETDKIYAFIDMGFRTTSVNIIANGKLELSRLLTFGGREIDTAVAPKYNLTLDKAESKKKEIKFDNYSSLEPDIREDNVRYTLYQQISEIQKLFQFYTSRGSGNVFKKIFLYGGASGLINITGFFKSIVNIDVEKIDEVGNIKPKVVIEPGIDHFLNAAAALIRY